MAGQGRQREALCGEPLSARAFTQAHILYYRALHPQPTPSTTHTHTPPSTLHTHPPHTHPSTHPPIHPPILPHKPTTTSPCGRVNHPTPQHLTLTIGFDHLRLKRDIRLVIFVFRCYLVIFFSKPLLGVMRTATYMSAPPLSSNITFCLISFHSAQANPLGPSSPPPPP